MHTIFSESEFSEKKADGNSSDGQREHICIVQCFASIALDFEDS